MWNWCSQSRYKCGACLYHCSSTQYIPAPLSITYDNSKKGEQGREAGMNTDISETWLMRILHAAG